jgi:hypothetical protein
MLTKRALTRRRNAAKRKLHTTLRRLRILDEGGPSAARERLHMAGCVSTDAIRRRILWLAHEWKLSDAQIKNAMKCRSDSIADFIGQHPSISAEWLLVGDLKALHKQEMQRRGKQ